MNVLRLELHFPSFYSYRLNDYSSQYALSLPLISPSALKLAIVSNAILMSGKVDEGKVVFDAIKNAKIYLQIPNDIIINSVFVKRLKKRKDEPGFQESFGVREYVYFGDDIEVYLETNGESKDNSIKNKIRKYAAHIKYLGTSDSLVYIKKNPEWIDKVQIPTDAITPVDFNEIPEGSFIFPVKDFAEKVTFEQINPYVKTKTKGIYKVKFYYIKGMDCVKGKNWTAYKKK